MVLPVPVGLELLLVLLGDLELELLGLPELLELLVLFELLDVAGGA